MSQDNGQVLREIERAQRTLDDIESRMRSHLQQKDRRPSKAPIPCPDLSRYFTCFLDQQESFDQHPVQVHTSSQTKPIDPHYPQDLKENTSLLHNHLPATQNNTVTIAITKLEEYYDEQSKYIDQQTTILQQTHAKVKRDQMLLLRHNQQLSEAIQFNKHIDEAADRNKDILLRYKQLKNQIQELDRQNLQLKNKKIDLQSNIKDVVQIHKEYVAHDLTQRPKSVSNKCPFHK